MRSTIVIPAWREAAQIGEAVLSARALGDEVIVADGGSDDETAALAEHAGARVIQAPKGRGLQLKAGAHAAAGDLLFFLHADCRLPPRAREAVDEALADPDVGAGTFGLRSHPPSRSARFFDAAYAWQRRRFGLTYGDCGLFVRRRLYEQVGGHRPLRLMEGIDLLRRLRRESRVVALEHVRVEASSRRFTPHPWKSGALYAALQTAFVLGVSPDRLAALYDDAR